MYQLSITRKAGHDLIEAASYYEGLADGLGDRFMDDYQKALRKIESRPESLRFKGENHRMISLKKFPYQVYFALDEIGLKAKIFAVIHERSHPDKWQQRIS